jgi:hypothetical protein
MEEAFTAFTAFLIAALPIAVSVTKVVDLIRNLFGTAEPNIPRWVWNVLAFVIGVAFCLGWNFNLFEPLVAAVPALKDSDLGAGSFGEVLTGIAIGGMAGFWHEKLDEWSAIAKVNKANAPAATQV